MLKFRNCIKYDDIIIGEVHYNAMHDKSVYEIEYHDVMMEQLTANIIAKNMISQDDYEVCHYQVLTGLTDHKRDDSAITMLSGFIKSSSENLHRKIMTPG